MSNRTLPLPALAQRATPAPTVEVVAKFHLAFEGNGVGSLELAIDAAPLLEQMSAQVSNLTDDDLQAVAELFLAADLEVKARQRNEQRTDEFMQQHRARLAELPR